MRSIRCSAERRNAPEPQAGSRTAIDSMRARSAAAFGMRAGVSPRMMACNASRVSASDPASDSTMAREARTSTISRGV